MYVIRTPKGALVDEYAGEDTTLYVAVRRCAAHGEDTIISEERGNQARDLFYIEADTKVKDNAPTFPVIVHILPRPDGPSSGAQC